MKRCARCNKKRSILDRIFGLDKEFCDGCLMVVNPKSEKTSGVHTSTKITGTLFLTMFRTPQVIASDGVTTLKLPSVYIPFDQ